MTRADLVAGLLLAAFFGAALWEAFSFQYGTEFAPGPGFAPVWLSAIGLAVSLLIAMHGFRALRSRGTSQAAPEPPSLEKWGVARVALTLLGLSAMIALVPMLGLTLSLVGFLLYLTLVVQRHALWVSLVTSVGTAAFVYLVFVRFLEVPVPAGPLGF